MWWSKCKQRLTSYISEATLAYLNDRHRMTGVVDFSTESEFELLVDFLVDHCSTDAERSHNAHLWFDDDVLESAENGRPGAGMQFVRVPLSLLEPWCRWVAGNFAIGAIKPHYVRTSAERLAGTWAAVVMNQDKQAGQPYVYAPVRLGAVSKEPGLCLADIEALEATGDRCAPLWRPPGEAFVARQKMLAARSAESRRVKLDLLLEVPPGLTIVQQIKFLAAHGVTASESTVKREWKRLLALGEVDADDVRRPQRGRPPRR